VSHDKPTPPQSAKELEDRRTLKRAHFILPKLATVYPISAANPPHMPTTQEEKRVVEAREGERRRRVVRGNSVSQVGTPYWNANLGVTGTNGRTSRSGSVSGSIRSANASGGGDGLGDEDSIPEGDESGHGDNEEEEADYWGMDKVESFYRECCESREDFPHPRISAALKVGHLSFHPSIRLSSFNFSLSLLLLLGLLMSSS
jgi:protein phosphatase 1 regulatory subunit 37